MRQEQELGAPDSSARSNGVHNGMQWHKLRGAGRLAWYARFTSSHRGLLLGAARQRAAALLPAAGGPAAALAAALLRTALQGAVACVRAGTAL